MQALGVPAFSFGDSYFPGKSPDKSESVQSVSRQNPVYIKKSSK
jgi:hypothetical protein